MGHQEQQRVLVRMMYDDAFAASVHQNADETLDGLGLTAQERAQLQGIDLRALRTDPLRRRRTLRMLVDEFKISTTLALSETRSLQWAEGFFASEPFHGALMARGALYEAYGSYLAQAVADGRLTTPQLSGVIALESAMARCRRDARRPTQASSTSPKLQLAPGVSPELIAAHVVPTIQAVEQYLFEVGLMPMVALCEDGPRVGALPAVSTEQEPVLLSTQGTHVSMTYLEPSLHALLRACAQPTQRAAVVARFGARGVPASVVREALESLLVEGLLVEG